MWRRSLIVRPDGSRDATTRVQWLQGGGVYIDLRQPQGLPSLSNKRGVADLSIEDCVVLASQEAFAGQLAFDGNYFHWARHIDFQPESPSADVGSLEWAGDALIERGRDIDYVEHWHRDEASAAATVAGVTLQQVDDGRKALLLRVGAVFMFARERTSRVALTHATLRECIADVSSPGEAQALIDCEISFGTANIAGLRIVASTLPYRVGDRLAPEQAGYRLTTQDRSPDGGILARQWEITESEGDMNMLAGQAQL
jgi:hypothetical protein